MMDAHRLTRLTGIVAVVAIAGVLLAMASCSPEEPTDTSVRTAPVESLPEDGVTTNEPPEAGDAAVAPDTHEGALAPGQPTLAEAEAAILAIAREEYPDIPALSVHIVGTGTDDHGRWWFQAWTDHGEGYESEQWFCSCDHDEWMLRDYGTGLERTDLPTDIAWADIP